MLGPPTEEQFPRCPSTIRAPTVVVKQTQFSKDSVYSGCALGALGPKFHSHCNFYSVSGILAATGSIEALLYLALSSCARTSLSRSLRANGLWRNDVFVNFDSSGMLGDLGEIPEASLACTD